MPVVNDPRAWSPMRKNITLLLISSGALIAGFAANIQNPAIQDMEASLPATSSQISLSISLFILVQGSAPLLWSAISEVKGRRFVYLVSMLIFFGGSVGVAVCKSIGAVIGLRIVQAAGSSAVIAIGAATLADVYEPSERGTKMGIYYMAPALGPSLGPIFGGVLTNAWNWRAPFWFLAILSGTIFTGFVLFFRDTFRKERSSAYQALLKDRLKHLEKDTKDVKDHAPTEAAKEEPISAEKDVEKQTTPVADVVINDPSLKMGLKDVTPLKPIWLVLRRLNNFLMLFASGLIFALCFTVPYTSSRTLGTKYGYNSLNIGLVLLAFGIGNMVGSIFGGRWSDIILHRQRAKNGGKMYPEMRLYSTLYFLIPFPISTIGMGWVLQQHVHVAAVCVLLFITGFIVISVYTSTIAYIVDANVGRSSTAVALNSFFRGMGAFIAVEVAVPIQDSIGDGWMYTIFGVVLILGNICILLTLKRGHGWRVKAESTEK
ncbi:MFS general substrate transporter [Cylindrobasidium torrendii FP15055 ss-10]|uniref:MFS general substrate transporter n=1 Tax=Cylindrobasidium torrendii FP15055 ss-10 TaxID=1314674 RepID=A0A0D7BI46_9AGAR|nr:MFS general substrate transporter [Cylindrobasidium torrendii FP15055 ss-10]